MVSRATAAVGLGVLSHPSFSARVLGLSNEEEIGVSDGTRTRDIQIHNLRLKGHVVVSYSPFLHLASPFSLVFGSNCSQVVPKFMG